MTTPILGLTELIASQSQPHIPLNTSIRALEATGQICVVSVLSTPPGSPAEGDTYIVGAAATGAWAGAEDSVAVLIGGGWSLYAPISGWIAYDQANSQFLYYDGGAGAWTYMVSRGIPHYDITTDTNVSSIHNGGKLVVPVGTSPAVTITVPTYSSDALGLDFTVTIVNMAANPVTIQMEPSSPTTDYLYLSPGGTTANLTLDQYGIVTLTKVTTTDWLATGVGVA